MIGKAKTKPAEIEFLKVVNDTTFGVLIDFVGENNLRINYKNRPLLVTDYGNKVINTNSYIVKHEDKLDVLDEDGFHFLYEITD